MPIFICPTCLAVANTACDYYWSEHQDHEESCTGCRPDGYESKHGGHRGWHGRFPRKKATGKWLISIGYLTDEFACRRTPIADQLVGEALERGATKDSVGKIDFDDLEFVDPTFMQRAKEWWKNVIRSLTKESINE
jgi:hypothetical protein